MCAFVRETFDHDIGGGGQRLCATYGNVIAAAHKRTGPGDKSKSPAQGWVVCSRVG